MIILKKIFNLNRNTFIKNNLSSIIIYIRKRTSFWTIYIKEKYDKGRFCDDNPNIINEGEKIYEYISNIDACGHDRVTNIITKYIKDGF